MIYRIEIENFYSIRDPQVLDLRVSKSVPDFPERFAPIFPSSDERVAKVISFFGPNGSGKSTVLKALAFVGWFLRWSFEQKRSNLPCERFNDEDSGNREIRLAIELGAELDLSGDLRPPEAFLKAGDVGVLRYELRLQPRDGVIQAVSHEALRMKRKDDARWQRVFERTADRTVLGSKMFSLSGYAQVIDKIREDASVVSTLALFEHQASKTITETVERVSANILIDRADPSDQDAIQYFARNPEAVAALNRELQRIDVGVDEMRIVQAATGPLALFRHRGLHVDMPWLLESHGTRSFIRIFPMLLMALSRGGVAIVDELDQSIHPLILPEILRWFYDRDRNAFDAQLWMSCHSASLLDDLTKEQIVFCDKDNRGRSLVYSLMDVGAVRRTDNHYKKYLGGSYGAVPQVG